MRSSGLLAHLADQLTDRRERLATTALCYLLDTHPEARAAMAALSLGPAGPPPEVTAGIHFEPDVFATVDGKPGYTDVEGRGPDGTWIIVEGKFGAPLQPGTQPEGYLKRLTRGGALIVVCPRGRLRELQHELFERAVAAGLADPDAPDWAEDENGLRRRELRDAKRLGVIAWTDLLAVLAPRPADGHHPLACDADQLEGLVQRFEHELEPWTLAELRTGGAGATFTKAVRTVDAARELLRDAGATVSRAEWRSYRTVAPYYSFELTVAAVGPVLVSFDPEHWGVSSPSPLNLWLKREAATAVPAGARFAAYLAARAESARLAAPVHPDAAGHRPHTVTQDWWALPLPLRPGLMGAAARRALAADLDLLTTALTAGASGGGGAAGA
ncbi:hypothetical protein ACWEQL_09505 [Kitasatospora sp. NPDC004240]